MTQPLRIWHKLVRTKSKMGEDLSSHGTWTLLYAHCNTWAFHDIPTGAMTFPPLTIKSQKVNSGSVPGNLWPFPKSVEIDTEFSCGGNSPIPWEQQVQFYLIGDIWGLAFDTWSEVKSLSRIRLFVTPMDSSLHQAPPSMGFSRQEYRTGKRVIRARPVKTGQ